MAWTRLPSCEAFHGVHGIVKGADMPESEMGAESAQGAGNAGNANRKPEADALQKMMKERFGDAKFGTLMNSIVDEMFKNMATVDSTPNGPYTPDAPPAQTEKTAKPVKPVNPAPPADAAEDADYAVKPSPDKPGPDKPGPG